MKILIAKITIYKYFFLIKKLDGKLNYLRLLLLLKTAEIQDNICVMGVKLQLI